MATKFFLKLTESLEIFFFVNKSKFCQTFNLFSILIQNLVRVHTRTLNKHLSSNDQDFNYIEKGICAVG